MRVKTVNGAHQACSSLVTRWNIVAELYWHRRLSKPFNLSQVPGLNYKRYDTVQGLLSSIMRTRLPLYATSQRQILTYS
jgi:hypothetical protein